MSPSTIIMQAKHDGVLLRLSENGNVKAIGDQDAIARWREIIREHKLGIIATLLGRDLPEPTHPEALALHKNTIVERTIRQKTPEQEAKLRVLVASVGVAYAFTYAEQQEALSLVLNDPDTAVQSYRATTVELGIVLNLDDRRYCDQCTNLQRDVCTIAEPRVGALVVANRGYHPVREPPRRCAGYAPGPGDPDRRLGQERWPGLQKAMKSIHIGEDS